MSEGSTSTRQRRPAPPALSAEQRKLAYDRSLAMRRLHAEYKQLLAAGDLTMEDMFDIAAATPGAAGNMRVKAALQALPGIGKIGASKLLAAAKIPEKNTFRVCGKRQREKLLELLS